MRIANHQSVAEPVDRFDEIVLTVGGQGAAQCIDVRAQRIAVQQLLTPHFRLELSPTEYAIRRLHQDAQQMQTLRRLLERRTGALDGEPRSIVTDVGAS